MTTDLSTRIDSIKAECEEILQQASNIAGPGKWEAHRADTGNPCVMCGEYYVAEMTMFAPGNGKHCTMQENASFIAHARNTSPAMARVVLAAIDFWQLGPAAGYVMKETADAALESIANQWEGK